MAIDIEREPRNGLSIQDDPMRAMAPRNGSRPVVQFGDPVPLGLAALGITLLMFSMFSTGHAAAAGPAAASPDDGMSRRGPVHQPIA